MEHNFFDSVFVLLFYFCFIFYFLFFTDARRASDKNRVRKIGVMSRDFAPPLPLGASSLLSVSVSVSVSTNSGGYSGSIPCLLGEGSGGYVYISWWKVVDNA